ncbi:MAG: ABC transporter substrate-binding protein [Chloroflexota bacterium]|nr:ABC transporter substrate-binding protein [Chloroflexota bacterium]MDE3193119.1 ABC transporter substrate-binding protein [Chloroflexota bacterium]
MRLRVLVTVFALVLAACAPSGPAASSAPTAAPSAAASAAAATPAPEPAVTVTFWHGQSGVLGDRLKTLVDKFNASHKVQVNASFQGSYTGSELQTKLLSAVQAGNPPDMAQLTGASDVAQFYKAKAIVPIQQLVDGPNGLTKDQLADFVPSFLDDNSLPINGKSTLVSWPLSKSESVMYYNPDILKAAGVSVPKTWDEFRAALKTVKEKTSFTPMAWTPSIFDMFLPQLYAAGGSPLSADLTKATFNSPEGVAALQYEADLVNVDKTVTVTKGFDWQDPFAQGKVAFAISTNVSIPYIQQAMPKGKTFQLGMAPLPAGAKGSKTSLYGNNVVIFAKAAPDHQLGAWIFLKWLTDTDQTVAWSLASGYMPLRTSAKNSTEFKAAAEKDPRLLIPLDAATGAVGSPKSPDFPKIQGPLGDAITAAILGKSTPKAALDDAAKKANDILSGGY